MAVVMMILMIILHGYFFLLDLPMTLGAEQIYVHNAAMDDRICSDYLWSFEKQVKSKLDCSRICAQTGNCASFFYKSTTTMCVGCTTVLSGTCGSHSSSGYSYYHAQASTVPGTDCVSILAASPGSGSGVYSVTLTSNRTISVYCDMVTDGGGWTVFQYRHNGELDFYRTFQEYTDGFGDLNSEFWLGLENIHEMVPPEVSSEVYLLLVDAFGSTKISRVSTFAVGPYPCFTLTLQNGDSGFTYNHGASFSAKDFGPKQNCVQDRQSGWWHLGCTWVNPNGIYVTPGTSVTSPSGWAGVVDILWKNTESLAVTKIMFRRV